MEIGGENALNKVTELRVFDPVSLFKRILDKGLRQSSQRRSDKKVKERWREKERPGRR